MTQYTHSKIFICKEGLLGADPCIPLLSISHEHLQFIALAKQVLPLLPHLVQPRVFLSETNQPCLDLRGRIVLLCYQRLQKFSKGNMF